MLNQIKKSAHKIFPGFSRKFFYQINSIRYSGNKHFCPICEKGFSGFLVGPDKSRENSKCPGCGSLERQRLLWLYLVNERKIKNEKINLLNIAPDYAIQTKLKKLKNISYTSIDIESELATQKADITNLKFSDNSFDVVLCYHVLEHVGDDQKAISEIFRVLKSDGWAILQSPINENREFTFEDFTVKTPQERKRVFGQEDHVRIYGRDYVRKLEDAGFIVDEDNFVDKFSSTEKERYLLDETEVIYFCRKLGFVTFPHN